MLLILLLNWLLYSFLLLRYICRSIIGSNMIWTEYTRNVGNCLEMSKYIYRCYQIYCIPASLNCKVSQSVTIMNMVLAMYRGKVYFETISWYAKWTSVYLVSRRKDVKLPILKSAVSVHVNLHTGSKKGFGVFFDPRGLLVITNNGRNRTMASCNLKLVDRYFYLGTETPHHPVLGFIW